MQLQTGSQELAAKLLWEQWSFPTQGKSLQCPERLERGVREDLLFGVSLIAFSLLTQHYE